VGRDRVAFIPPGGVGCYAIAGERAREQEVRRQYYIAPPEKTSQFYMAEVDVCGCRNSDEEGEIGRTLPGCSPAALARGVRQEGGSLPAQKSCLEKAVLPLAGTDGVFVVVVALFCVSDETRALADAAAALASGYTRGPTDGTEREFFGSSGSGQRNECRRERARRSSVASTRPS